MAAAADTPNIALFISYPFYDPRMGALLSPNFHGTPQRVPQRLNASLTSSSA